MNVFQNIKHELQKQGYLTILLVVNIAMFLGINLSLNLSGRDTILGYIALPLDPASLLTRFWTPLTYMFMHLSFGHLLSNMLLLFFTGRLFTSLLPEKKLLYVYLMSGLSASLFMIVFAFIFPQTFMTTSLLGSSAAIMGIISCIAIYSPSLEVNIFGIFQIRYVYVAALLILSYTLLDISINTGGKLSHLAGVIFGLVYGYSLRHGKDFSGFSFSRPRKSNLKVVHKRALTDDEYNSMAADNQKTLDDLLDKVYKSGYESLSKSEKETLFKLSQKK
ncbi:MAG: rhomboid family intramembrane serine protease [Bacteroidetes bacterium]|nr:rhomboid family intramembrane serine protease [Bacteroidota bacterium]